MVGVGSSKKKTLAATGMIQQVHRRAVNGEARGVTMVRVRPIDVFFVCLFTRPCSMYDREFWFRRVFLRVGGCCYLVCVARVSAALMHPV